MAEAYGVNRMTVKRAISKLVEEGYLVCKPGSGTYVAQRDKKKIDLDNSNEAGNTGITATLRKGGMEVKNRLLGTGEITGSKYLGYKLGISDDEMIYGIYRVRSEGDIPLQWSIHMYRKNILMIWMNLISPKCLYMIIWKQKDICHAILDRSWSYVRQMNGSQSCCRWIVELRFIRSIIRVRMQIIIL